MNEVMYIETSQSKIDRYNKIQEIIGKLYDRMLNFGADTSDVDYYILDDGQSKITTSYRSIDDIMKAIKALEFQSKRLFNELNGHCMIMRDVQRLSR